MAAMSRAARQPLALVVLVAALLGGLTIAIWLLPLGLVAYGAMVVLAARDPQLIAVATAVPRPDIISPTYRPQIQRLTATQQEIGRVVAAAQGPLARLLGPVSTQTSELVGQSYALAEKGQIIEGYLGGVNLQRLTRDVTDIDAKIAATTDDYTLTQLQQTRAALVQRKENAAALQTFTDRIAAQLQNIEANLDNVLAETVRLRTVEAASASVTTNDVAQRLSDLNADMDAFQHVLDDALLQSRAAA